MNHYLFVSPDNLDGSALKSIEALDNVCEGFYSVALENNQQLAILLKLLSIDDWLRESGRESNMDEYCQLIFLHRQASVWNQRQHKIVLSEKL